MDLDLQSAQGTADVVATEEVRTTRIEMWALEEGVLDGISAVQTVHVRARIWDAVANVLFRATGIRCYHNGVLIGTSDTGGIGNAFWTYTSFAIPLVVGRNIIRFEYDGYINTTTGVQYLPSELDMAVLYAQDAVVNATVTSLGDFALEGSALVEGNVTDVAGTALDVSVVVEMVDTATGDVLETRSVSGAAFSETFQLSGTQPTTVHWVIRSVEEGVSAQALTGSMTYYPSVFTELVLAGPGTATVGVPFLLAGTLKYIHPVTGVKYVVPSANVELSQNGALIATVTTDANGRYSYTHTLIEAGTYTLSANFAGAVYDVGG